MNINQLRRYIIKPVLEYLDLYSQSAENLLIGTAMVESRLHYIHQLKGGPALGIYQMEPNTHDDIYSNYLAYRPELKKKALSLAGRCNQDDLSQEMIGNFNYSTAMSRIHYLRVPERLPDPEDVIGLANYWKKYYNTELGAGHARDFVNNYPEY